MIQKSIIIFSSLMCFSSFASFEKKVLVEPFPCGIVAYTNNSSENGSGKSFCRKELEPAWNINSDRLDAVYIHRVFFCEKTLEQIVDKEREIISQRYVYTKKFRDTKSYTQGDCESLTRTVVKSIKDNYQLFQDVENCNPVVGNILRAESIADVLSMLGNVNGEVRKVVNIYQQHSTNSCYQQSATRPVTKQSVESRISVGEKTLRLENH